MSEMHEISTEHQKQAEIFYKVMLKKDMDVYDIADTLGHMGQMLLLHAGDFKGDKPN